MSQDPKDADQTLASTEALERSQAAIDEARPAVDRAMEASGLDDEPNAAERQATEAHGGPQRADAAGPDDDAPVAGADHPEHGGTLGGVLITLLVLAVIAVGAFFYFGGRADVDIEEPEVEISGEPNPPTEGPDVDVTDDETTDD